MNRPSALPVLIVDGHRLMADALADALARAGFSNVQCADPDDLTLEEIVERAGQSIPTLVVVTLRIAGGHTALALVRALTTVEAIVVVASPLDDDALLGECLMRGAEAIFERRVSLPDVTVGLARVMTGENVMPESNRSALLQAAVAARAAAKRDSSRWAGLTGREREVLEHLARGLRVRDIAELNHTQESTVRTQVKRVLEKLNVNSQTSAVAFALRAGWFGDI